MKKLLTATILATTMTSAYANIRIPPAGYVIQNPNQYQSAYNSGYHNGKQDAYHNVAKTVFITAVVVVSGTTLKFVAEHVVSTNKISIKKKDWTG